MLSTPATRREVALISSLPLENLHTHTQTILGWASHSQLHLLWGCFVLPYTRQSVPELLFSRFWILFLVRYVFSLRRSSAYNSCCTHRSQYVVWSYTSICKNFNTDRSTKWRFRLEFQRGPREQDANPHWLAMWDEYLKYSEKNLSPKPHFQKDILQTKNTTTIN